MANSEESVSISEFARQVGKSAQWISKKSRDGTIPRTADGKIPLKAGLKAYDKMLKQQEAIKAIRGTPKKSESDDEELSDATAKTMSVTKALNKARLAEKTYQAKLKELEYKLRSGELVEVEKVRQDAQAVASALRENLMSIPVRISGLCEGRPSREIEEIIESAINDAMIQFQKTDFK